jgi:hypothetical protein
VEGHVRIDEAPRRAAVEIADESRAGGRHGDRARVDEQLLHVVEGVLAPQQPERVGADRRRGTDAHDAAPLRRQIHRVPGDLVGGEERDAELDQSGSDRDVDAAGQRRGAPDVAHDHGRPRRRPGDDALPLEHDPHLVRAGTEQERQGHHEQRRRGRAGDEGLDPSEREPGREACGRRQHRQGPGGPDRRAAPAMAARTAARPLAHARRGRPLPRGDGRGAP